MATSKLETLLAEVGDLGDLAKGVSACEEIKERAARLPCVNHPDRPWFACVAGTGRLCKECAHERGYKKETEE